MPEENHLTTEAVINDQIAEEWQEKKQPLFTAIPAEDIPAYPSFETLDQENPTTDNNFVFMEIQQRSHGDLPSPDKLAFRYSVDAKNRLSNVAGVAYSCCMDYEDMFKPTTLSGIATFARMTETREEPGFHYTTEAAVRDFYGEIYLNATKNLVGHDVQGARQIGWMDYYKRKDFPAFLTHLSHYAPSFAEATQDSVSRLQAACTPERLTITAQTEQLLMEKIDAALKTPPVDTEDWFPILDLINELKDTESRTSGQIRFLVYQFRDFTQTIPESAVAKLLDDPENQALISDLSPFTQGFDSEESQIREMLGRGQKYVNALPGCQPFIEKLTEAVMQDAVKIGALVDKLPNESDVDYMQRISALIEGNLTDIEKEMVSFLDTHQDEIEKDPATILKKISEICGVDLEPAMGGTPHTFLVDEIAHDLGRDLHDFEVRQREKDPGGRPIFPFAVAGESQILAADSGFPLEQAVGSGDVQTDTRVEPQQNEPRVLRVEPLEDIVKRRVLIAIEGSGMLQEYRYLSGESVADTPLDPNDPVAWPNINVLTREQYQRFATAMHAIAKNINWKRGINH